jgi:hypothetical protein
VSPGPPMMAMGVLSPEEIMMELPYVRGSITS